MRQCFPGCVKFPPFRRNAYCLIKPRRVLQRAQKYMTEGRIFAKKHVVLGHALASGQHIAQRLSWSGGEITVYLTQRKKKE